MPSFSDWLVTDFHQNMSASFLLGNGGGCVQLTCEPEVKITVVFFVTFFMNYGNIVNSRLFVPLKLLPLTIGLIYGNMFELLV